jgi:hypothetical protein
MANVEQLSPLDQEAWAKWVEYRKIIKKPLKPANYPNTMRGLQRFGKDQMAVVQQSLEREWQGLFELKERATLDESFNPQAPW